MKLKNQSLFEQKIVEVIRAISDSPEIRRKFLTLLDENNAKRRRELQNIIDSIISSSSDSQTASVFEEILVSPSCDEIIEAILQTIRSTKYDLETDNAGNIYLGVKTFIGILSGLIYGNAVSNIIHYYTQNFYLVVFLIGAWYGSYFAKKYRWRAMIIFALGAVVALVVMECFRLNP